MPRDELSRIRASLLNERAQRAEDVVSGKPASFDAYKHEVGYIKALDFSVDEILRIIGSDGDD